MVNSASEALCRVEAAFQRMETRLQNQTEFAIREVELIRSEFLAQSQRTKELAARLKVAEQRNAELEDAREMMNKQRQRTSELEEKLKEQEAESLERERRLLEEVERTRISREEDLAELRAILGELGSLTEEAQDA